MKKIKTGSYRKFKVRVKNVKSKVQKSVSKLKIINQNQKYWNRKSQKLFIKRIPKPLK